MNICKREEYYTLLDDLETPTFGQGDHVKLYATKEEHIKHKESIKNL